MAQNPRSSHRLALLARSAVRDKATIYNYTADQWCEEQADDYIEFLDTVIQQLADNPAMAARVPDEKNTRSYVARWNNTRQGHRIFFEENEVGILVLRILHTAQNWPDYLPDRE